MNRATDDQIARMIQLDPSETGSGFNAPMLDLIEDWHDEQGRDPARLAEDIEVMGWFGKWAWRLIVAASVVSLSVAFYQAWGAQ